MTPRWLRTQDKKEAMELFRVLKRKYHQRRLYELDRGKRVFLDDFTTEYIAARPELLRDTLRLDKLALKSLGVEKQLL